MVEVGFSDGAGTLELDSSLFKIGMSKIFFKPGILADLEERRDLLLFCPGGYRLLRGCVLRGDELKK